MSSQDTSDSNTCYEAFEDNASIPNNTKAEIKEECGDLDIAYVKAVDCNTGMLFQIQFNRQLYERVSQEMMLLDASLECSNMDSPSNLQIQLYTLSTNDTNGKQLSYFELDTGISGETDMLTCFSHV